MLIYIQNKDVAYYGSSYFWKTKFNRDISYNARPYIIITPFSPVTIVYDITDTIGSISTEELLKKGIPYHFFGVEGVLDEKVYDKLLNRLFSWRIPLIQKPLSYFEAGNITTLSGGELKISINTKRNYQENFTTIIHELAHLLLGHTSHKYLSNRKDVDKRIKLKQRAELTRSEMELEAETIAYLICNKYGLLTQSAEYLASYIHSEKSINNFNYELVIHTVDKIERMFLK